MRSTKTKLIHQYGTSVVVQRLSTSEIFNTKAIIGRATSTITNMSMLEDQKEVIFDYLFDLKSGDFVINQSTNEKYVVGAIHNEMFKNDVISHVGAVLKCNNLATIKSLQQIADNRGNLKNQFVSIYNQIPCFVKNVGDELKQYDSGLHPDTEYRIYTTLLTVKETDKIYITVQGQLEEFKILTKDYISFSGMLIIDVCRDIRK